MAPSVKHAKVSAIPDSGDATLVEPSDWNAGHVLTGVQGTISLTTNGSSGAATFAGDVLNIPVYSFSDTGITQLTGDVTAGPGSGSQAATVVAVNGVTFSGLATGILKNTTGTGAPSIAAAGDFPTLNQNTTGSAAKWTTARNLAGNSVDGSANVAFSNAFIVQGTADSGLSGAQFMGALGTGIVKNTTTTGVLSIAVAGDFPTLNQDTSGNAATATSATKASKWTTARNLAGNSVDGTANVAFANKFIVQGTADSGLSAAQFLGSLGTGLLKNTTTTGVLSAATAGTDYSAGTSALGTGILKSTTTTGALTIAVAGDFPTLNQNTTGSAATLTTARSIYGHSFDGSADLAQIIASTFGGTGNGFTKFSGPATAEKTFTLPNASAAVLTDNALVTVAQGGTGLGTLTAHNVLIGNGTSTPTSVAPDTSGNVLTSNGTDWVSSAPTTGVPIPSSSTYAVGMFVMALNGTGSSVTNGSTAAGSSLNVGIGTASGFTAGNALTGTWKNISGQTLTTSQYGLWVRTV